MPTLDEEMWEFLKIIALRHSTSLNEVRYKEFAGVFSENYELVDTQHDDESPFVHEN